MAIFWTPSATFLMETPQKESSSALYHQGSGNITEKKTERKEELEDGKEWVGCCLLDLANVARTALTQQLWLLARDSASQIPNTNWVDDPEAPPLAGQLLAVDSCWKRKNCSFFEDVAMLPWMNPYPYMYIQAALAEI